MRGSLRALGLTVPAILVIGIVVGVNWAARRLDRPPPPTPGTDLDVPPLVGAEELTYEWLLQDTSGGVPILCYHYFGPGVTPGRLARVLGAVLLNLPALPDREYWTTPRPEFERQMRYLAENGWRTAFLDDVVDDLERGYVPPKTIVLTIDDGDRSFVDHAVPVLRRHGFVATLFMLTGRAGERNWNDLDLVDWETMKSLEGEGLIRVESHSHRMHTKVRTSEGSVPRVLFVGSRDPARLRSDLRASRSAIFRELGREPRFLAWPFGQGRADLDSLALATGFRRVLTLRAHRNDTETGMPVPLGRYAVTARTSFRVFRLMLESRGDGPAS